ncbi:MAG: ECF transporter S component [Clostridia bacterium]|nr:ECF transporter S component [Clostridia bacterium]
MANQKQTHKDKTYKLVLASVITALIIIMAFTPLGYPKIGPFSITLLMIPVAIGAILLGPVYGAFFGFLFGLTSFLQCVFALDPVGALCLNVNPFLTVLFCIPTRILAGFCTGLVFKVLHKSSKLISYVIASASSAVFNTLFFVPTFVLCFGYNAKVLGLMNVSNAFGIVTALVTVNAIVELAVCLIVGAAISKALSKIGEKYIK